MKSLFPKSLRWQIGLALCALVVITIGVSWTLTNHFTARDFETFVTTAAMDQAREYAHLLEARYNLQGGFGNLADFLVEETGYELAQSDDDEAILFEGRALGGWDAVVAEELGLSTAEYREWLLDYTPAEVGEELGVTGDEIVAAIMQWENDRRAPQYGVDDIEAVFLLAALLDEAEVYTNSLYLDAWFEEIEDWSEEYENPVFYEAPILVVDVAGNVLFDGLGASSGVLRDEPSDHEQGFPIRDWQTGQTVGYVLSAREPWEFSLEETTFLGQARAGLLVGGVVAALIALGLGFWIARRISYPVSALRESAVRLASGETIDRLPVSDGELGAMSSAFNAMADSLAQQDEVRSRMISDLSHELNTPLSVLQLELEALRDGLQPPDEAVVHMSREVDLLRNLAADVGMLAENEAGLLTIQREVIDLREYLPVAAGRWQTQAEAVGIALDVTVPADAVFVEADPTRLSQTLGNLIRNALQHTDHGGRIGVRCAREPVPTLGGIWNVICVQDSGAGIAAENLQRIFERSVRALDERTGRGLGLTIARQIIEAHDGHIWAESTLGEGSTFCIALP